MTFYLTPRDIKSEIVSFIKPSKIISQEVKHCGRIIVNLSLTYGELKNVCEEKLKSLKKIHELIHKYNSFNGDYGHPVWDWDNFEEISINGNPQLYDALLTGFTNGKHSFEIYNSEIEEDIKAIIKLTPQNMNFDLGALRTNYDLLPIYAACINVNIPTSIVEFLLASGANPNSIIQIKNSPVKVISYIQAHLSAERYETIFTLFKKYGMKSI